MKCAFNPCPEVDHLPVRLTDDASGIDLRCCNLAHCVGALMQHYGLQAEKMVDQASLLLKNPDLRKSGLKYLVERFL